MKTGNDAEVAEPESATLKNEKYFLDNNSYTEEISRLNRQYMLFKDLFGHNNIQVLDPSLDTLKSDEVNILDAATGTGAWLLDVAQMHDIQPRLSPSAPNPVKLYACDITSTKFVPGAVTNPHEISFFPQDITKPFSEEMKHKFNIVHLSLMAYAFTMEAWTAALNNIFNILKPGGYLLLVDYDLGARYPTGPPLRGNIWDVNAYISDEPSSINKINSIFIWCCHRSGFLIGLSYHLRNILEATPFNVVSLKNVNDYYGAITKERTGLDGKLLDQCRDLSLVNLGATLDAVSVRRSPSQHHSCSH